MLAAVTVVIALCAAAAPLRMLEAQRPVPASPDSALDVWMASQGFHAWTPAHAALGNSTPRYPDGMRREHVAGSVLAQFVVDTSGTADMRSFSVLESTNAQFTESVRSALGAMHFVAAEVDGRRVKQLVQVPVEFSAGSAVPAATPDSAHRTVACRQAKACPVHRLQPVVVAVGG